MNKNIKEVTVVGAGLAGSEAALQLAARGVSVRLVEMRSKVQTAVHKTNLPAELVCSNSFKTTNPNSASGALKDELEIYGSYLLREAKAVSVAAGGALAVDRVKFSRRVKELIDSNPLISYSNEEVTELPLEPCIIATGPLTSDALSDVIAKECGNDYLAFFDAAAPIIEADSIDMEVVFAQSRYGHGGSADYLNAPFNKEQYESFYNELICAERVIEKDFERKELFAACQPLEEVARTGIDALRFGALKPVGITDPKTGKRPYAAVQLRAENKEASAYNLVGFQTNLKFPEQKRLFRMIPGLENAEFARFGVMHRNTFIDSPHCLSNTFALPNKPHVHFAGQLTGTEGYCEAIASGLYMALVLYAELKGFPAPFLPNETMFGSLLAYATDPIVQDYQPMHVNYGILKPIKPHIKKKVERHAANANRARKCAQIFVDNNQELFPAK